jgi:hypothetical protein
MAYTTIKKPSDYFNTVAYSGTGVNPTSITSVGFQPDFLWIKSRSDAFSHLLFDAVRGVNKRLISNSTGAESTEVQISSFDANGWTMDSDTANNGSGKTYVAWNWLGANGTASNTDGSITSTVSANTTSGFSIVSYTGTGANATVGHGLGVAPSFVIIKDRDNAVSWVVSGDNIGWDKNMYLNSTQAVQTANHFQDTAPTSSLMYLSTDAAVNGSSRNYIMYCFADVKGFSKIGSYTGNGNADGTFIYTGFKPAFILVRATNLVTNWHLYDNKRDPINPADIILRGNSSNAEATSSEFAYDFVSNGFKARSSGSEFNGSGNPFIYMAFAEEPLVGDNPATAR